MEDEEKLFIAQFLALSQDNTIPWQQRLDNKACYLFVKFLIDGEWPEYKPTVIADIDKIGNMLPIVPPSMRDRAERLFSTWKLAVCKDPEQYYSDSKVTIHTMGQEDKGIVKHRSRRPWTKVI